MKPNSSALVAWGAMLLALPAAAQEAPRVAPTEEACRVAQPVIPLVEWRGVASYRARAKVKDGRVVRVEVSSLNGGVERRAQRSLVMAISDALRAARCPPGDREFQQDFSFDLRQPPASSATDAGA